MRTRRDVLKMTIGSTVGLLTAATRTPAAQAAGFTLPKLPYAVDALEPSIDAETMTIHHTRHHQAYVDNLNKALGGTTDRLSKPIEEVVANYKKLPEAIQPAVRNNGGGHLNHSWLWRMMAKPGTGGEPKGDLLKAIETSFGTLDGFTNAGLAQFGSGWAWLVVEKDKPSSSLILEPSETHHPGTRLI